MPLKPATIGASAALVACCLQAGLLATPLQAQADCDDVSGAFSVNLDLPGSGPAEVTVTLEQSVCEVTGTIVGRTTTPIDDGSAEGSTATFTTTVANQAGGPPLEITWEMTVDGDDVLGTFSSAMFGSVEFVGSRIEA